jgi:hypothetical protein
VLSRDLFPFDGKYVAILLFFSPLVEAVAMDIESPRDSWTETRPLIQDEEPGELGGRMISLDCAPDGRLGAIACGGAICATLGLISFIAGVSVASTTKSDENDHTAALWAAGLGATTAVLGCAACVRSVVHCRRQFFIWRS